MNEGRVDGNSATLLPDGRVLVAGGDRSSAELYDPRSGTWTPTAGMIAGRGGHTATLLPDGRVLVAGGLGSGTTALASAQLYDPVTGSWTATASLTTARLEGRAVLLPDGSVLVVGGSSSNNGMPLAAAEVYQP